MLGGRWRSPRRWAGPALAMAAFVALSGGACGEDCDCGDNSSSLFVELHDPVPGGSVEACFEERCAETKIRPDVVSDPTQVAFLFDDLGDLRRVLDAGDGAPVTVDLRVRDERGEALRSVTTQPALETGSCCGDYWLARA